MFSNTITYVDFNDVERTETFYFNLTESELVEMELTTPGGLSETLDDIMKAKDLPRLFEMFKMLVFKAYGEKSSDGKRFVKSPELSEGFFQTNAYDVFFRKLTTNDEFAAEFINNIIPKRILAEANAQRLTNVVAAPIGL